ncbi:MAG: RIP metalloprotease RseP [Sphingobacteriia bacterium 24-36-13]|uniref:RIP metalloprotease RseP n=1 Tax=Sediminibacterium sp. TaxID=1917865 RepID=UPI000BD6299A|nr:RIP metalloprotease RseP [Sediminibacterium sp.]OYY09527.1 MAG: RIP metalloprotease RseP [Sphingobacteriia bacterium 35-36-14]OYZ51475.1 MAG: RIP metalloprotease RseP [Sphingobacteriia bacterium 24-36-13]OZA62755.1 MAG: RIP metalloprotease RseP [Sphingobacteriia bacterium 39-36-14]HQS25226.1 RIP metalloprotease RseP [Sediminibacterium sp.]HQS36289.1 RIP metalloprotease RseP [Sediminibacterium sp.]
MMLLAIDWASVGVKAGQFILSFSILVVLHELGHFLPAKWFGCRVDKFYLFFDPWFSLFKKKKGDTEYGLGWIPFGGYVKIAGMIDESMDKEQMKKPAEPWEFRSKPAWQRLIIMVGGVVVNILLAIVIFIGITWYWGDEQLPVKNLKYGVHVDSLGKSIGLKDGDNVVAIDGKAIENFGSIESELVLTEAKKLTVIRDGQPLEIVVPESFMQKIVEQKKFSGMLVPQYPVIVDSVSSTAVFNAGELRKGDTLIAMNGKSFTYYQEFDQLKKSAANTVAQLTAIRGKDTVQIKALVNDKGAIGFFQVSPLTILGTEHIQYDLMASIPIGFTRCWETLDRYVTGLKQLFTGKVNASDSLGSVISIGNTFPGVWDWERFWTLTGIFSIVLAFMNILPIPALDGGHALFTLYEMVSGRKPGDKFMEYAQMAGMILLMGLMAYALGLDFWRLFK